MPDARTGDIPDARTRCGADDGLATMSSLPAPTTRPLRRRFDALGEALLAQATTDGAAGAMLAAPSKLAPGIDRRKAGVAVAFVLAVAAVLTFTNGPAEKLTDALTRVAH